MLFFVHHFLLSEIFQEKQAGNVQYNRPVYNLSVESVFCTRLSVARVQADLFLWFFLHSLVFYTE